MDDKELELQEKEPEVVIPQLEEEDLGLNLDDILKEFSGEDIPEEPEAVPEPVSTDTQTFDDTQVVPTLPEEYRDQPVPEKAGATVRFDLPENDLGKRGYTEHASHYVPPQPIVFRPRSRLRELKKKLVAGPEHRYYELSELGFGKLQLAIFLSFLVAAASSAVTIFYSMGMFSDERQKLVVFGQFFVMMLSALLGCYQLMDGVGDLFRMRFSPNTMLVITFGVCCADSVYCLRELRVPCCAAFSLQVFMSLWAAYNRRDTEMGQMDTMRKATRLDSLVREKDFYDGCDGLLRSEGQVEDFMEDYKKPSAAEKVLSVYCLLATLASGGCAFVAWKLHGSISFAMQVAAISMLAALPVTSFITLSRPMAILERRLHKMGTVLCGWRGIKGLSKRAVFPITHEDLFPSGACRMNGVKFYGDREPDDVVAYAAAVIAADGGGLKALFDRLLDSKDGPHYPVENLRTYGGGGLGAEVCGEPVLLGVMPFLKEMGVEIPEGIRVNQAVYVAIDGELSGLFAVNYLREPSSAMGLRTLCGTRRVRPVMTTGDFMLTESFIRSKFGVNSKRIAFPEREVRQELLQKEPDKEAPGLALITKEGFAPYAYAVTGARALRRAWTVGTVIHILGGLVGIAMMAVLAYLGAGELLTPANVLLYELVWLLPGLLVTEWTRIL